MPSAASPGPSAAASTPSTASSPGRYARPTGSLAARRARARSGAHPRPRARPPVAVGRRRHGRARRAGDPRALALARLRADELRALEEPARDEGRRRDPPVVPRLAVARRRHDRGPRRHASQATKAASTASRGRPRDRPGPRAVHGAGRPDPGRRRSSCRSPATATTPRRSTRATCSATTSCRGRSARRRSPKPWPPPPCPDRPARPTTSHRPGRPHRAHAPYSVSTSTMVRPSCFN